MATVELPPEDRLQVPDAPPTPPAREPRRPRRRRPSERRLAPAGKGFIVLLIALVFAAFLNARGMHKTAAEQSPGAVRDVSMLLTARLVDVSSALDLDQPRSSLKEALGRKNDDTVNSQVSFAHPLVAAGGAAGAAGGVGQAPPPVFGPARPLRVYITGDSLVTDPASSFLDLAQQSKV